MKKTRKEIQDYKKFMEEKVKGIADGTAPVGSYDKGWYDAVRWFLGEWP